MIHNFNDFHNKKNSNVRLFDYKSFKEKIINGFIEENNLMKIISSETIEILKSFLGDVLDELDRRRAQDIEYELVESVVKSLENSLDNIVDRYMNKIPWVIICMAICFACNSNKVSAPKKYERGCKQPAKFSNFSAGFKEKNVSPAAKKRLQNYRK